MHVEPPYGATHPPPRHMPLWRPVCRFGGFCSFNRVNPHLQPHHALKSPISGRHQVSIRAAGKSAAGRSGRESSGRTNALLQLRTGRPLGSAPFAGQPPRSLRRKLPKILSFPLNSRPCGYRISDIDKKRLYGRLGPFSKL